MVYLSLARRLAVSVGCLAAVAGLGACAPYNTGTTYSGYEVGRPAAIDRGVIVAARDVEVRGPNTGVGTVVGAGTGAVAGSYIGHGGRGTILGVIGGAVIGGIVGSVVEDAANRGLATEFIIQRQDGAQFSVVQTNEDRLQIGERVLVIYGAQTRLTRDNGQYAPQPQPYSQQQQPQNAPAPIGPPPYNAPPLQPRG